MGTFWPPDQDCVTWRTVRFSKQNTVKHSDHWIANSDSKQFKCSRNNACFLFAQSLNLTCKKHNQFTRHQSEGPTTPLIHLINDRRHRRNSYQYVGYRHVDYLKICDSSHFLVFVHDADYQHVSEKCYEDDESVGQCLRRLLPIRGFWCGRTSRVC